MKQEQKHRIIPSVVLGVFLGSVMLAMAARYEDFIVGKLTVENTATFESSVAITGAVTFSGAITGTTITATSANIGPSSGAATVNIVGTETNDANLVLDADDGDDNADTWTLKSASADNNLDFLNHTTEAVNFSAAGVVSVLAGLDAIGAVDMDYGSADVTDHTFITDGTGDAEFVVPAGSISSTEVAADIVRSGDGTARQLIQSGTVTMHAGTIYTQTFNTAYADGAVPIVTATYTEDPGTTNNIFITGIASNQCLFNVEADKNFNWIAIGVKP